MKKGRGSGMRQPAPTSAGEVPETPARGGANHGHAALSGVVVGDRDGLSPTHTASLYGRGSGKR